MTPFVFWLALAWGVDAGYEPAPDGHLEYIIQIEPEFVGSLAAGHDVTSEVPTGLDVRYYRVIVGTATLPRNAGAAGQPADGTGSDRSGRAADQFQNIQPTGRSGYQALPNGGGEFLIEIDPASLSDLDEHDVIGAVPPGVSITRFVVSTKPGTVPLEQASRWGGSPTPAPRAVIPAVAEEVQTSGAEDDPSVWKPGTATTAVGPLVPVPHNGLPDDNPGGSQPPPAAGAPPGGFQNPPLTTTPTVAAQPPSEPPFATVPGQVPANLDPPDGRFEHGGGQPGAGLQGSGMQGGGLQGAGIQGGGLPGGGGPPDEQTTAAPATLRTGTPGKSLAPTGFGGDSHDFGRGQGKAHSGGLSPDSEKDPSDDRKTVDAPHKSSQSDEPAPYLPLMFALGALFASLGANVYLSWTVWEMYHTAKAHRPEPRRADLRERKPALSR